MNDNRSPLFGVGLPVETPSDVHLAGNFRALLHRHAQTLGEPMRGAINKAADLIDVQRASYERLEGLYEMALRREGVLLGQLSLVRQWLTDASPDGASDAVREVLRIIK